MHYYAMLTRLERLTICPNLASLVNVHWFCSVVSGINEKRSHLLSFILKLIIKTVN